MTQLTKTDQLDNLYEAQEKLEDVISLLQTAFNGTDNETHANAYIIGHLQRWLDCEMGGNSGIAQYIYTLERQCAECGYDRDECECEDTPPPAPQKDDVLMTDEQQDLEHNAIWTREHHIDTAHKQAIQEDKAPELKVCPECDDPMPSDSNIRVCSDCGENANSLEIFREAEDNERQDLAIEAAIAINRENLDAAQDDFCASVYGGHAKHDALTDGDMDALAALARQHRDDQAAIEELSRGF